MSTPYPTDVVGPITKVIGIIKGGQIVEQKAEFGRSLWEIQGVMQKMLLGDPDSIPPIVAATPEMKTTLVINLDILAKALQELDSEDAAKAGMDMAAIMAIVKLILELLKLLT